MIHDASMPLLTHRIVREHPYEQVSVLFAGSEWVWGDPIHLIGAMTRYFSAVVADKWVPVVQN